MTQICFANRIIFPFIDKTHGKDKKAKKKETNCEKTFMSYVYRNILLIKNT